MHILVKYVESKYGPPFFRPSDHLFGEKVGESCDRLSYILFIPSEFCTGVRAVFKTFNLTQLREDVAVLFFSGELGIWITSNEHVEQEIRYGKYKIYEDYQVQFNIHLTSTEGNNSNMTDFSRSIFPEGVASFLNIPITRVQVIKVSTSGGDGVDISFVLFPSPLSTKNRTNDLPALTTKFISLVTDKTIPPLVPVLSTIQPDTVTYQNYPLGFTATSTGTPTTIFSSAVNTSPIKAVKKAAASHLTVTNLYAVISVLVVFILQKLY